MGVRSYREVDIKRLFALSHNACAFPGCDQKLADVDWPTVQAEICHIYGLNPNSARHDPSMTDEERNSFENLILLCPNHHRLIDDLEPQHWPAERLLQLKADHERQRPGDRVPDHLVHHAVVCLVAKGSITLDQLDSGWSSDDASENQWLDPATGMGLMLTALAQAQMIEAKNFGAPSTLDTDTGWVELGLTVSDYFDLLVARGIESQMPIEDLAQIRHLRTDATSAFGRIPGC